MLPVSASLSWAEPGPELDPGQGARDKPKGQAQEGDPETKNKNDHSGSGGGPVSEGPVPQKANEASF